MTLSSTEDEKSSSRPSRDRADATPGVSEPPPQSEECSESLEAASQKLPSRLSKTWTTVTRSRVYRILSWTPPRCRWNPDDPPKFSMALNCLFAFAGAFTVANLYYSHPILNILAHDFNVTYEQVSQVPTLAQAGYAVGLGLLCPLGDVCKRRPFTLLLVLFTATVWIGLCLTKSLAVFSALTFITAVTTVTPQIMLPLVGDLAPLHRRAAALSVVVAGLTLGILVARVLSGVVVNYTSWRNIYWLSCGLQYLIFGLLWLFMPDYPSTNPDGFHYLKFMWSIVKIFVREPLLIQACLISYLVSATFTNFWTTLTFLLAGEPYNYKPLPIGLFGLIGIAGIAFAPIYGRLVTDRFHPWLSVLVGLLMVLVSVTVGTYTGTFTVAGPIVQALMHDAGMQTCQVANRSQIYSIAPRARNRINTAFMLFTFFGQITGTSAGNTVYAKGGWIHSGSMSVGLCGGAILLLCLRGPWEKGWIGWHGGASLKREKRDATREDIEASGRVKRSTVQVVDEGNHVPVDEEKALNELVAGECESGKAELEKQGR
ncbi:uncharacterized protein PV09_01056 [Verruconis gallopava]|uniref:Major facilitator superfamily (MFS) profile domain-containing protein n=1 Tax=Verruconis gallopava TaxID=253628 RepID=A0A0D1XZ92_9PEZI|nr:uncharacterized protein PV09_01056 [Verruconis gallopava]KIW08121.1 hypothetical protein PV09_01056 [Verruconis gallopava]